MSHKKKPHRSQGSIRSVVSGLISLLFFGVGLFVWFNQQYIVDSITFHQYTPTQEVSDIATKTTMTDEGRFYFYASKPSIEDASHFNESCQRKEAGSAILGCYANNQIFVYNVTDEKLTGIREVTAAHEMLHAVYQRLSSDEKVRLEQLLEAEYAAAKDNTELAERMDFYAKHEPGEKYNELHSIVATEFDAISTDLEAYYQKYFSDRQSIVRLHNSYASVFTNLQKKADELLAELKVLGPQLEADSKSYNDAARLLQSDIQAFNKKAASGGFSQQESAFTAERNRLIARNEALDKVRQDYNKNVARYEALRQEYNNTAASSQELYKSLDSKLSPTPNI